MVDGVATVTKLEPFTQGDFYQSFMGGIFWGLTVWGVVSVLAWLVVVMRQRSGPLSSLTRSTSSEEPAII
jgi:hypothetical protein